MDLASNTQSRHWAKIRRGTLLCTGLWCIGLGIGLIAVLVGADLLATTNTSALLMIVGLIVLPSLTLLAVRQDTRASKQVADAQVSDAKVFTDRPVVAHTKHDRSTKHIVHAGNRSSRTETHTKVA